MYYYSISDGGEYEHGDIRLLDGSYPWEGRVEIYFFGSWGTITDSNWTNEDAVVICHEMGHILPGFTTYYIAYCISHYYLRLKANFCHLSCMCLCRTE